MRIVVNDIAASSGGALTILKSFYNFVLDDVGAQKHQWFFLLSDNYIEETEHVKVIVCKDEKKWVQRLKFDLFAGAKLINELEPDVFLSLQNTITKNIDCPQIVYMHQSLPFQNTKRFSFFKSNERALATRQFILGNIIKKSLRKADHVIVQTNWIREEILKCIEIKPDKITKIDFPDEEHYKYKKEGLFQKNSFFYPASKAIYKNHDILVRAVEILKLKGYDKFEILVTHDSVEENDVFVNKGIMDFKDVLNQYNKSTLIFPSVIETLGLPLLEAKQLDSIILASNTPFAHEALDGYQNAYFFNPFKPEELATLMELVMIGNITRKNFKTKHIDKDKTRWKDLLQILEAEANIIEF